MNLREGLELLLEALRRGWAIRYVVHEDYQAHHGACWHVVKYEPRKAFPVWDKAHHATFDLAMSAMMEHARVPNTPLVTPYEWPKTGSRSRSDRGGKRSDG